MLINALTNRSAIQIILCTICHIANKVYLKVIEPVAKRYLY